MFKKIMGASLVTIMIMSMSGCSFNMPVVANNHDSDRGFICYENRIIIDVANNTTTNRLNIPNAVEKALLEKYDQRKDTRETHTYKHTENYIEQEERCRKTSFRYASNVSAMEAAQIRYDNCMDFSGPRTTHTVERTGSFASIRKQDSSDKDILLQYYIETQQNSQWNAFDFTIKIDGDFIVLYIDGKNGCSLPNNLSEMISSIVKENDDNFLNLQYYKL